MNETGEALKSVLAERFAGGFRLGSGIELNRLRASVNAYLGADTPLTDDDLEAAVRAAGTVFEGKLYVVGAQTEAWIRERADAYFDGGATAIFYEAFYAAHAHRLSDASVVSEAMLTDIFRAAFPNRRFTRTHFGTGESVYVVLESELLRVWGDAATLTFETVAERLPYIPLRRIKQHLAQNGDFVWNAVGTYTHISRFDITDEEIARLRRFADHEVSARGYVAIPRMPLGDVPDRNGALSVTAVHGAVFRVCLSDAYERHDKIVTRRDGDTDAKHIMDAYCRTLDRCSTGDLLDFGRELTGGFDCYAVSLQAAYDTMVRTDRAVFVAEKHVCFDTAAIDDAIEYFMNGGEYIPLRAVTTFAPFPHCGLVWNAFLLESYAWRFSANFRFAAQTLSAANAGVIVRKHSRLTYGDILTDAVARSGVPLAEEDVLNFLAENGYLARRRYGEIGELIRKARILRG